jgi:uncharacterized membrane protein
MSTASQTPRARHPAWWAVSGVATLTILALAMTPFRDAVLRLAAQGSLHAPDFSLIAGLSPVIRIHLFSALAALVLGGVLMAVRKGRTFHRVAGWTWVGLVSVTAGATLFITQLNHGSWSFLHLFTGWTLLVLPLAVFAARRHDVRRHRRTMMVLFYGGFAINLFIAFMPGRTLWMTFFG